MIIAGEVAIMMAIQIEEKGIIKSMMRKNRILKN